MAIDPRRTLPLIFLCALLASPLFSLGDDSAFFPAVRSQFSNSLLDQAPLRGFVPPVAPADSLRHPFQNWSGFTTALGEAFSPGEKRRALLQYDYPTPGGVYRLETNFLAGYEHRLDDPGDYGFLYKGLRVNSSFGERFRARATWWNGRFYNHREALGSPLIDGFNNLNDEGKLLDNLNGELSYEDGQFTAALGRGRFQLVNSLSGSVVLSDRLNEYDFVLLEQKLGQLRFSFMHGTLQADSTKAGAVGEEYPVKYLAAHQISYRPAEKAELFIGETVIYGNQIDLGYLLPAYFWRIGKYSLRDRDNLMIYMGANYQASRDLTLYLNLALDELTYNKFYTNWWGNKYAVQTGAALNLPGLSAGGAAPPRCALEFTAIRPWTYTHYANVTMYSHDALPLGYPKGSNLLDLSAELNLPLPFKFHWDSRISLTWQGSVGNDWRLNYKDFFPVNTMEREAYWLEGDVSFGTVWENSLRADFLAHHSFLFTQRTDFRGQSRLSGGWQFSF